MGKDSMVVRNVKVVGGRVGQGCVSHQTIGRRGCIGRYLGYQIDSLDRRIVGGGEALGYFG